MLFSFIVRQIQYRVNEVNRLFFGNAFIICMSTRQSLALNFSSTPNKSRQNTFFHYLPEGGSITAAKYRSFSKITSRLEKRSLSSRKSIWACPPKIVLLNCIFYYWKIQRSNLIQSRKVKDFIGVNCKKII